MKKNFAKEYLSIPNLLGYFRLILVPFYLYIYINATSKTEYYIAAFLIFLSLISDFFDGKIARKFNMVTDFGKMLDPIADKVTQGALALSFAVRYPIVRILLVLFLVKETIMGLYGLYLMKHGHKITGAQLHGKITTFVLDITMFILLLFPVLPALLINILVIISIATMTISFVLYMIMYSKIRKDIIHKKNVAQ